MITARVDVLTHQQEFALCREKNVALVGGYGSGKSEGAVYRAMDLLKQRKWAVVCIIAPTYGLVQDVNIPDFERIFEHYAIRYQLKKQEKKMIVNSGGMTGEIWFRSGERPERIVGFDATDIIFDEYDILKPEKQREAWNKALARTRGAENSTMAVTTTPEGFRETYQKFQKDKIGPLIRAKTTDNPFLPADYVQSLYDQYDEMLVKQYINAEFVNINGAQAYYAFSRGKNHWTAPRDYAHNLPDINIGMDFNVAKMCAEVFHHDRAKRSLHFFDEIIIRNSADTEKMCRIIKDRYKNKQINIYPDATGKQRSTNATQSDIQILRDAGFKVYARNSNPFVRDRLAAANNLFSHTRCTVDTDACPDLTEDLEQVVRDKYGEIDKSDEQRTHSSDAATYPAAFLYPVKRRGVTAVRRSA